MRSMAGGVGTPGGEGVAYSPTALAGAGLLGGGEGGLGLLVVVPELQQHLAAADAVAFLHVQPLDAPAQRRGQAGAPAGFDAAGAGVGDRGIHPPAPDLDRHHGHRPQPLQPGDTAGQSAQHQQRVEPPKCGKGRCSSADATQQA